MPSDVTYCKMRGWGVGDYVDRPFKTDRGVLSIKRYKITAFGEEEVLLRPIAQHTGMSWRRFTGMYAREQVLHHCPMSAMTRVESVDSPPSIHPQKDLE